MRLGAITLLSALAVGATAQDPPRTPRTCSQALHAAWLREVLDEIGRAHV